MNSFAPDTVFYAIGDVHGEAARLRALHEQILDHHEQTFPGRPIAIIHLGDYVDRGPDSKGVIDAIMALEARVASRPELTVLSLRGNHEQMMLDALDGDLDQLDLWLRNGGRETLRSYTGPDGDIDAAMADLPKRHIEWLSALPTIFRIPQHHLIFVHAGIEPRDYPNCNAQRHLWTRSPRFFDPVQWAGNEALSGMCVVHGHTPTVGFMPEVAGDTQRINVDTGAVYGGQLTAVVIADNAKPEFLTN